MRSLVRRAPAKLNLTLEILGRRGDGYHEVRSVMTTLALFDTIEVSAGQGVVVTAPEDYDASALPSTPDETNSIETALRLMVQSRWQALSENQPSAPDALLTGLAEVSLRLRKQIPAAAGLGGGSSDAVAALLGLNRFWEMNLDEAELRRLAAAIGSDCPFFVRGGAQLAGGRGEKLDPLPTPAPFWVCLLKPPLSRRGKTEYLYSLLSDGNFSDGAPSALLAQRLRAEPEATMRPADLCNGFDQVADQAYGNLSSYRQALAACGALAIHLCGSGPTLYGLFAGEAAARAAEAGLRREGFDAWAVSGPAAE